MTKHPYIKELLELFDVGMTDLNANLEAIDSAKGNLDLALNYLLDGKSQEQIVDPYMKLVQNIKYPHMK